jgi:hypothetical protein
MSLSRFHFDGADILLNEDWHVELINTLKGGQRQAVSLSWEQATQFAEMIRHWDLTSRKVVMKDGTMVRRFE